MRRFDTILVSAFLLTFLATTPPQATPFVVEVDISSFSGSDFLLEIDLFDANLVIGDSWAFIDNIFTQGPSGIAERIDFESGLLEGFNNSLNPDSVDVVAGGWGTGSKVMRIDEDPVYFPTITFRDFAASDATLLHMEFDFFSNGSVGIFGQDALVASLLDPITFEPLITGISGLGDFLEANASDNILSDEVTRIAAIPEPDTLMLLCFGILGLLGIKGTKLFNL